MLGKLRDYKVDGDDDDESSYSTLMDTLKVACLSCFMLILIVVCPVTKMYILVARKVHIITKSMISLKMYQQTLKHCLIYNFLTQICCKKQKNSYHSNEQTHFYVKTGINTHYTWQNHSCLIILLGSSCFANIRWNTWKGQT